MNRHPLTGPTHQVLGDRERIDWHFHDEQQLVYASHGALRVATTMGSWVVPPQRAVWLPAGIPHEHQAHGETQMRTFAVTRPVDGLDPSRPTVLAVSNLLREVILALTGPELDDDAREDLLRVALRQLHPVDTPGLHLPRPVDPRLCDVVALLEADPADERTLAELGRAVGAGERTLSRLFRAETGLTFPRWRALLRLHVSLAMLAAGSSVTSTALACGYGTPSAFIAAFRATFDETPAGYQRSLERL